MPVQIIFKAKITQLYNYAQDCITWTVGSETDTTVEHGYYSDIFLYSVHILKCSLQNAYQPCGGVLHNF